jgi:putative ABC transport system permease protein
MLYNYLKICFRNLLKYKVFSFINVFGLASAMTICMLIILMLSDQKSYDRFNTKKERIYRVLCDKPDFRNPYATSPFPLAATLSTVSPVVERVTHLVMGVGGDALYKDKMAEMRGYFADTSFLNVFSFELEKGNASEVLKSPNTMVITAAMAKYLFKDQDPIGKRIEFTDRGLNLYAGGGGEASASVSWGSFTVTGVIADKNYKSHLKFDALVSMSSIETLVTQKKIENLSDDWKNLYRCYTYALLDPGKKKADLDRTLSLIAANKYAGVKDFTNFKLLGQKLTEISPGILLGNEPNIALPRIVYYFLSLLALIIMISACLNYLNLSVARALTRSKEIGVRKVNGATKKNLVLQFLTESVVSAFLALACAMLMLFFVKNAFTHLWVNQYLNFNLDTNVYTYVIFIVFALLIGIAAGLYPSFYLSRFHPVKALKNTEGIRPGRLGLRKVLSVTQFAVSLIFIISSVVLFNQFRHFLTYEYGFNHKNIVNVELQGSSYQLAARTMGLVPGVGEISGCDYIPVSGRSEGMNMKRAGSKEAFKNFAVLQADENFADNLQLKFVAGTNFLPGKLSVNQIVVNQAAVREAGYKNSADMIGQPFESESDSNLLTVIGVVKDFKLRLDQDGFGPLVLQDHPERFKYMNVHITSNDTRAVIAKLEEKWKTLDPVHPLRYRYFDEQIAATSQGFFDMVSILGFISFIAVTIACLGLLGMATYTTERRMKEVGIRKVLGAKNTGIVLLLSKEFLKILVIAVLIAGPLSYLINNLWLRNFPNRVAFGIGTILIGVLILFSLGLISIASQTIIAALRKPVDSLRND